MVLDNFRRIDMKINKANDYYIDTQFAKEGDYNGRELVVQITNAGEITSQQGVSLNLGWRHDIIGNSGLTPFEVEDVSTGIFKITYPNAMLNAGSVTAFIQIIENGKVINTRNFVIEVEDNTLNARTIVLDDSFETLNKALISMNDFDATLAQKADSVQVDNLETIVNNMVISNDLSPNKDPEVVGARLGYPTLAEKIANIEQGQSITNDILIDEAVFNDFTGVTATNTTTIDQTRIINKLLPKDALLMSVTVEATIAGQVKIKYTNKNDDGTFSLVKDIATITVTPGLNTVNLNYMAPLDGYIGVYSEDTTLKAYPEGSMSYVFDGDLVEKSSVTSSGFNVSLSLMVGEATNKIEEKLNQTIQTEIKSLEEKVGEITTYNDYSDLTLDRNFGSGVTRIINEEVTSPATLTDINISAYIAGDALIKIFKKTGALTFDLVEEFTVQLDVGDNTIDVDNKLVAGNYIGVHANTARIRSEIGVGTPSLFLEGDIKGDGNTFNATTSVLGVSFKTFSLQSNSSTQMPYDYAANLMQLFPKYTTVGDSLTAGFTSVDGTGSGSAAAAQTKNNWPGFLSLRTGRTFNNIAVGGSTSKDWRETHLQTGNIPTDCYIVALGVNDARQGLAVGSPSDIVSDKSLNADTFYGNYDFVVRGLLEFNPTKDMFVLTMPAHEANAETYNVVIRHVAGLYENVHLIDMYNIYYNEYTSGFLPNNYINTHYTPLSYNYISTMIEWAINGYLFDNFEYFQKVPYK